MNSCDIDEIEARKKKAEPRSRRQPTADRHPTRVSCQAAAELSWGSPQTVDICQAARVRPNAVIRAAAQRLDHEPVSDDQSIEGTPSTATVALGAFSGMEVGIWEMTPGVMRGVENDEIFVVLSGSATVEFAGGAAPLVLSHGDVVQLAAGNETVWKVTETLRKVYLST